MINAIQIALSGLNAASRQVQASANNIANAQTVGSLDPASGQPPPYAAETVVQTAQTDGNGNAAGVQADIVAGNQPFVPVYSPDSPFANADGLVGAPNVDLAANIVNMQVASASYKANLKTIQVESNMQKDLLNMVDQKA